MELYQKIRWRRAAAGAVKEKSKEADHEKLQMDILADGAYFSLVLLVSMGFLPARVYGQTNFYEGKTVTLCVNAPGGSPNLGSKRLSLF